MDESANVVGVVQSKMDALKVAEITADIPQNVNFAIKVSALLMFLDSKSVKYSLGNLQEKLAPADIAERANKFTVLLSCVN